MTNQNTSHMKKTVNEFKDFIKKEALVILFLASSFISIVLYLHFFHEKYEHPRLSTEIAEKHSEKLNEYAIERIVYVHYFADAPKLKIVGSSRYFEQGDYEVWIGGKPPSFELIKLDGRWRLFYEPNKSNTYDAEFRRIDRAVSDSLDEMLKIYNNKQFVKSTWE